MTSSPTDQPEEIAREQALIDEVIGFAWDDHVTFESIQAQTGYTEREVIALMRRELKASSFRMWRERVSGRKSYKHRALKGRTSAL